jgi:hypothetical protein
MVSTPLQLNAGCPAGQSQPFYSLRSDGASILFKLHAKSMFALTDVSIVPANMSSATPTLIAAGIRQVLGAGHVQRWNFAGYVAQNVERSFNANHVFDGLRGVEWVDYSRSQCKSFWLFDSLILQNTLFRILRSCSSPVMNFGMTRRAQRNQVRYCVVSERTAKLHVMSLQVFPGSANLATPAIPPKYSSPELTICSASKSDSRTLRSDPDHAISFSSFRSSLLCGPGTNANRRRIESKSVFELGSSRLAPARKSAQIISRQNPRDFCAPSMSEAVSIACSITAI